MHRDELDQITMIDIHTNGWHKFADNQLDEQFSIKQELAKS